MAQMTTPLAEAVETTSFSRRVANLLAAQRRADGVGLWRLSRRSQGQFSMRRLRGFERGVEPIDHETAIDLAALYGADLAVVLGDRLPIEVTPDGLLRTGGVAERFDPRDPDSMLRAYLVLVRRLRRREHDEVIDLRRDDVEVLARELGLHGLSVIERLGALMGATRTRRTSMAVLFGAGVAVIGVATGVAALSTGGAPATTVPTTLAPTSTVSPAAESPTVPETVEEVSPRPERDAIVAPVIVPAAPVAEPPAGPTPTVAAPAPTPVAPSQPGETVPVDVVGPPPVPPSVPIDVVGPPPVPPGTSPPPVDTLAPGTPLPTDPPPPVVPPDDEQP